MSRSDHFEVNGIVTKTLHGSKFEILIKNEKNEEFRIIAKPCGKMQQFNIKILLGDKVRVEMSPYDLTKGIIVWRH